MDVKEKNRWQRQRLTKDPTAGTRAQQAGREKGNLDKEWWSFLYKPGAGASSQYATKFEGNLVLAINGNQGELEDADFNTSDAAKNSAKAIIDAIFGKKMPTNAAKAKSQYKLTDIYAKVPQSSKTSKTDILFTLAAARKHVSVKKTKGNGMVSLQWSEIVRF